MSSSLQVNAQPATQQLSVPNMKFNVYNTITCNNNNNNNSDGKTNSIQNYYNNITDSGIITPPLSANAQTHFGALNCNLKSSFNAYHDYTSAELQFTDFSLSYTAETPTSVFGEPQQHAMCFEEHNGIMKESTELQIPQHEQCGHSNQDVVFRFEPEDIARLTENNKLDATNMESTRIPYTPQTPFTPQSAFCANYQSPYVATVGESSNQFQATATSDHQNLGIDYFNYNEINCQSKNQSPCSSPPLDPWLTLNLKDTLNIEQKQQISPKLNNVSPTVKQEAFDNMKLPSMPTTFGKPKYDSIDYYPYTEHCANYNSIVKDDYAIQPGTQTLSSVASAFTANFNSNYHNNNNFDYQPENYENNTFIPTQKPNREHKFIWTIDELDEIDYGFITDFCLEQQQQQQQEEEQHKQQQKSLPSPQTNSDNNSDNEENLLDYMIVNEIIDMDASNNEVANHNKSNYYNNYMDNNEDNNDSANYIDNENDDYDDDDDDVDDDDDNDSVFLHRSIETSNTCNLSSTSPSLLQQKQQKRNRIPSTSLVNSKLSENHSIKRNSNVSNKTNKPQKETFASTSTRTPVSVARSSTAAIAAVTLTDPLICRWTDCDESFANQVEFVAHIEKRHVDVKRGDDFACFWVNCPRRYKPFNARYKLLIHMRVHSGEKPNKCPFTSCNKAFSRLENLKIHQRSHTGERPYSCQYQDCLKAFSNSSDRAKHQRTHYDTKPYACQLPNCTKRYTDPSSLRKHVKNHTLRNANGQIGRRKSAGSLTKKAIASDSATAKSRRFSESTLMAKAGAANVDNNMLNVKQQQSKRLQQQQQRSNSCSETSGAYDKIEVTNNTNTNNDHEIKTSIEDKVTILEKTNNNKNNSMNFNELSNCIHTIEHNQYENSINNDSGNESTLAIQTMASPTATRTSYAMLTACQAADYNGIYKGSSNINNGVGNNERNNSNNANNINQLNELELILTQNATTKLATPTTLTTNFVSSTNAEAEATPTPLSSVDGFSKQKNCFNKCDVVKSNKNNIKPNLQVSRIETNSTAAATTTTTTTTKLPTAATSTTQPKTINTNLPFTTNTISNNSPEFVSFEYVKKFFGETFDYIANDMVMNEISNYQNNATTNITNSLTAIDSLNAKTQTGQEHKSPTIYNNENGTSVANSQDFENNYGIDYLNSFL